MEPKPAYQSKTIGFNLLILAAGIAALLVKADILSPEATAWLLAISGAVNMILRFVTGQPIELPGVLRTTRSREVWKRVENDSNTWTGTSGIYDPLVTGTGATYDPDSPIFYREESDET